MRLILLLLICMMITETYSQSAKRIQRSASFIVNTNIEKAFPLFGPIREKDWCAGWEPTIIYSKHPEVEQHMIFKTPSSDPKEREYLWVVTQYDQKEYLIEYTVYTQLRIWFITVACASQDNATLATVTYCYTGFTEESACGNEAALNKMFAHNLNDWAEAINFYLTTGKRLE